MSRIDENLRFFINRPDVSKLAGVATPQWELKQTNLQVKMPCATVKGQVENLTAAVY